MRGAVATQPNIDLPDFVRPLTPAEVRRQRRWHSFVGSLAVPLRILGRCSPPNSFGILMYHRVCEVPSRHCPPMYSVTPAVFRQQLTWLLDHGYQAWPLDKLLAAKDLGEPLPERVFAVTFDDGYANNFTQAWPILEELQIPATIFLATAYIDSDQPFPFDAWMQDKDPSSQPRDCWVPLTLAQCRQMQSSGLIQFGCHTHTHADFRSHPNRLKEDLALSLEFMEEELSVHQPPFSYPFGEPELGFADNDLGNVVRESGCTCALQIGNNTVHDDDDVFHWPRFDVPPTASGPSLAGKLDGWSERISKLKNFAIASLKQPAATHAGPATAAIESGTPSCASTKFDRIRSLLLNPGGLALFDQAIISGTNFVTSLVVGRFLGKESLGILFITISIFTLVQCITDQIIHVPYLVRRPRFSFDRAKAFAGSSLVHQFVVVLLAMIGVICAAIAVRMSSEPSNTLSGMLGLLAVLLPGMMLREFMHNMFHNQLRQQQVVVLDASVAGLQLSLLLGLWWIEALTLPRALLVIGISPLFVSLLWLPSLLRSIRIQPKFVLVDLRENWPIGKWTLGSYLVGSSAPTVLPWFLAWSHGVDATGLLAACLTLVGIAQTFLRGLGKYMAPQMSVAFAEGGVRRLSGSLLQFAFASLVVMSVISAVLALGGEALVRLAYGAGYTGVAGVMLVLAIGCWLQALDVLFGNALLALALSNRNFGADCVRFAITVALAFLLIPSLSALGVAIALVLGMVAGLLVRAHYLWQAMHDLALATPIADKPPLVVS
ncbi:MAG: polysaccharide deacetylase family protein [Pirellulaceae bacterium]